MSSSPASDAGPRTATGRVAFGHLLSSRGGRAGEFPGPASLGPRRPPRVALRHTVRVPATILDGKATAATIRQELTARVSALTAAGHRPGLGTLLVGDDPGSRWYLNARHSDCAGVGIASIQRELPVPA